MLGQTSLCKVMQECLFQPAACMPSTVSQQRGRGHACPVRVLLRLCSDVLSVSGVKVVRSYAVLTVE